MFEGTNFLFNSPASHVPNTLRGNFFQCHVFAMKSVQNLKSFGVPLKITLF
jgi:hypothetical protein